MTDCRQYPEEKKAPQHRRDNKAKPGSCVWYYYLDCDSEACPLPRRARVEIVDYACLRPPAPHHSPEGGRGGHPAQKSQSIKGCQ